MAILCAPYALQKGLVTIREFTKFCRSCDIKHNFTALHHPSTKVQAVRNERTIKNYLKIAQQFVPSF